MEKLIFSFGEVSFSEGCAFIRVEKSTVFSSAHAAELIDKSESILLGKPFVAIFDQLDSRVINDHFSQLLLDISSMIASAFICRDEHSGYQLEAIRSERDAMPMMITHSISDALSWAKLQLKKHSH